MNIRKIRANGLCLVVALVWGLAFVAQSLGMEHCGPFLFTGIRNLLGGTVLLPLIVFRDRRPGRKKQKWPVLGGICCGVAFFVASILLQTGLMEASVGKASFIAALYVVLVPLFGLFFGRKTSFITWLSVALAIGGLFFLCMDSGRFTLEKADGIVLISTVFWAIHFMVIDYFASGADCVKMASMQFYVTGILSLGAAVMFESVSIDQITGAAGSLLYLAFFSSGVGYTLQMVAQKDTDPTSAALICSLESVFGFLGGWLFMGESFTAREILGCIIMFAGIILSQLPVLSSEKQ
ncbi:MAG: DMT family transporter [Ruminococcaceae bacterium]|nr:DMT family transporter [Oscillospiraceae bacterium]